MSNLPYMFRDYGWDDEKVMEFERFRFYLMSCVHFRQVNRFQAKYIRYRQFKMAVLRLLQRMLRKVLIENIYPSPTAVLRAIKTIKLPPLEGAERTKNWMDLFSLKFFRRLIKLHWEMVTKFWKSKTSPGFRACCNCICCGCWCCLCFREESLTACCYHWWCSKKHCGGCGKVHGKKGDVGRKVEGVKPSGKMTRDEMIGIQVSKTEKNVPGATGKDKKAEKRISTMSTASMMERNKLQSKSTWISSSTVKIRDQATAGNANELPPEVEWRPLGKPRCGIL